MAILGPRLLLSAILVLGGLVALPSPAAAAPVIPAGFQIISEPSGQGDYELTNFAILPDGAKFTIGKSGRVAWVSPDLTIVRTVAHVPTHTDNDIGLVGIWPAPTYSDSGFVYLFYTKSGADGHHYGRVSRFSADDPGHPRSLNNEVVIIDGVTVDTDSHGPGTVLAAADGTIYAGFGDDASYTRVDPLALRALDLDDPHGKILRFDTQGRGIPTNPFYEPENPSSWRSRVFAFGLRNPSRFNLDPRTGIVYLGDVGWAEWEEVNVARGGENFGWPCYEGNARTNGYQNLAECASRYASSQRHDAPLYTYNHAGSGAASIGGTFYTGTSYPEEFRGKFFSADYAQSVIRYVGTDVTGALTSSPQIFGSGLGAPVAVHQGGGDLLYADIISGSIKRLRYSPGNRPPEATASIRTNPYLLQVEVDARQSSDLDNDPLDYLIDFGDGSPPVATPQSSHRYSRPGTYHITVTVTDPIGAADSAVYSVDPSNFSPQLSVSTPPEDHAFAVGETVQIRAAASDFEDGTVPVVFTVVFEHCPFDGTCHAHPNTSFTGYTLDQPFPDHGDDTSMVVTVSATDSDGVRVSETYRARPDVHLLSVSSPVPVTINGFTTTTLRGVTGQHMTVSALALYRERAFISWSDNGAATHTIVMPAHNVTLKVDYATEIDTKYRATGGESGPLGPPSSDETEFSNGAGRYRLYRGSIIIWSPTTGAHFVKGALFSHYWTGSTPQFQGFPISDELKITGGYASYFQYAREYWSSATGAHFVRGAILGRYLALGGPAWGFPTAEEVQILGGGYVNTFAGHRRIYWGWTTGAHNVQGAILTRYLALGAERSCLGYPRTDEQRVSVGYQNYFQRGYIVYYSRTGQTIHKCT